MLRLYIYILYIYMCVYDVCVYICAKNIIVRSRVCGEDLQYQRFFFFFYEGRLSSNQTLRSLNYSIPMVHCTSTSVYRPGRHFSHVYIIFGRAKGLENRLEGSISFWGNEIWRVLFFNFFTLDVFHGDYRLKKIYNQIFLRQEHLITIAA